jgi:FtsP/CotA-like multicopper oxidase with cupredoxin domain
VRGGLAGAFIIGDLLSYPQFAQYRGATEVVMQIKEMKRNDQTSELYLNGNVCSALTIRAGEQQFWRIGNFTSGNFLNLKLQGYRFTLLALDGNRFTRPVEVDSIPLAPGGRAEVIVTGGVGPWESKLYTAPVLTRPTSTSPRVDLLELQVVTAPMAMRAAGVAAAAEDRVLEDSIQQLAAAPSPKQFTLRFGTPPPTNGFELNGLLFDENRQDISIAVGEPQEWTLINTTDVLHTFHIHQTDFLVVRVNGHDVPETVHQDNVWLGIHRLPNGTVVGDTVVVRFTLLPVAAGPMVTHCHVLSHEDLGMMANICVYDPAKGQGPGWCISQGFYKYTRENMPRSSGQSHGHAIHASRPGSGANGR